MPVFGPIIPIQATGNMNMRVLKMITADETPTFSPSTSVPTIPVVILWALLSASRFHGLGNTCGRLEEDSRKQCAIRCNPQCEQL